MIGILISLLILCIIMGVIWWILTLVPIPAEMLWIVRVIFALIFLVALLSLFFGSWRFPILHP